MIHQLTPAHAAHMLSIGLDAVSEIEISADRYKRDYADWKRTLPYASHEELHKRVLAHAAWSQRQAELRSAPAAIPASAPPPSQIAPPAAPTTIEAHIHVPRWERYAIIGLLLFIALLLLSGKAHAQFSRVNYVNFQSSGTNIAGGFFTYPFNINCASTLSCTASGNTLTISANGGGTGCTLQGGTNLLLYDTGTECNDVTKWQTNGTTTITALSTAIFDLTNAAQFKVPNSAGAAPTTSALAAYDTTANQWVFGQNGATVSFGLSSSPCATHNWVNVPATGIAAASCSQPSIADITNGCNVTGGTNGQVYESSGTGCGAYQDPIVSGPDAPGAAPTKNPVQMGLFDGTDVQRALSDTSGRLYVNVNGTVPVSGTFWQTTQPVSGTFWQSTQPVSNAGTFAVQAAQSGAWTVTGSGGTFPVTGTFWQATQPVSGTFWQTTQPVSGSGVFEVGPTTAANTATNPFFHEVTDGTNVMGAMTNFGSTPGAVKSQNTNASLFLGTVAATANSSFQPIPQSSSTYALSQFRNPAVTTAVEVGSTATHNLWAWTIYNPNASFCVLNFYNGSPTLGTTTPVWGIPLGGTTTANVSPGAVAFFNVATSLYVAAETTDGGGTTCSTGMEVYLSYQ